MNMDDDLPRDLARAYPEDPDHLRRLRDRLAVGAQREGILDVAGARPCSTKCSAPPWAQHPSHLGQGALDFEDLAVEDGGRLLAELVDGLAPQGEVGDAREDLICVDAHEMRAAQRTCWRWATMRPVRPPSSASVVR